MGQFRAPPPTLRSLTTGRTAVAQALFTGATLNLTEADTGKYFALMATSNAQMVINMPTLTGAMNGITYTFWIMATSTGGYQFDCGVDTDFSIGGLSLGTAAINQQSNGVFRSCGTGMDRMSIKSGETNGGGGVGSMIRITAIVGSMGVWGVDGNVLTTDATSTGAALFVNTS
jgi:hypothetical protein